MNQNNKRLVEEKQLNRFFELVNSVDRGKDYPPVFNVLEATGKLHLEARMHTPIIAYLLDPSARHRQEKRFLKLFIEEVGLSDFSYKNSWVEKESRNIDILIRNDSQIIIIENKIYADDGENQLNNYYQEMKKDFDDDNIEVIYLTLNGHKPSEQSIKGIPKEKKIKNISYHKHIANWLDKCVKEMVYSPPVREGLIQYREAVKILLGEDEVSMERQELAKEMKEKLNGDFIDTTLMMSIVEINQKLTVLKFVETLQEKLSEEYKCTPQYVSREDFLKKTSTKILMIY